jgi:hypothetical protein
MSAVMILVVDAASSGVRSFRPATTAPVSASTSTEAAGGGRAAAVAGSAVWAPDLGAGEAGPATASIAAR